MRFSGRGSDGEGTCSSFLQPVRDEREMDVDSAFDLKEERLAEVLFGFAEVALCARFRVQE